MPKSPGSTVVITGANGFLGAELVRYFSQKGWLVRALVRQPDHYKKSELVTYLYHDLTKPFDAAKLFKGADYFIHTAYVKDSRQNADALSINVQGTKALLTASRHYHLKHNVFISTMSAHSDAISTYAQQKLAIEALFTAQSDTILRCGLIIGDGGIVKQMATFMKSKHLVPLVGGGKQPLQIVALSDLAHIIDLAITTPYGGNFTVATPTVYTYRSFYQTLARHLNTPVLFVPIPFGLLMAALRAAAFIHLPLEVSKDNALGLKKLISVDTRRDLRSFGIKLHNLEEALEISHLH